MAIGVLRRRIVIPLLLLPALSSVPACITCSMWSHVDKKTSHRVAAGVATPVTLALDAAIIGGCIAALAFAQMGPSTMTDVVPPGPTGSSLSCGRTLNR